jgi:twinkle protein
LAEAESEYLHKEPCPKCGSSDALARYSDGHAFCFSCGHYEKGDGEVSETERPTTSKSKELIPVGEPADWGSRGITIETAKKWGFTRSEFKGEVVRVFNYRDPDTKAIIAQKIRPREKDGMRFVGPETKSKPLFGQHLWRDGGRKLVITEGEIDAMSVSQAQGHKWPVVSVPNGAQGAKKALQAHLAWLEKFDEVILMFDMDDAGRAAVAECAPLFSPGKCKVAQLPVKDANEMLKAGNTAGIIDAIWGAKEFRPDGLVSVDDLMDEILEPVEWGIPWCLPSLTEATYGRRWGEIYAIGAGTGIGKTDLMTQQMMFDITELGHHVGAIYLEQKPKETAKRVAGKIAGKRFHIPSEKGGWTAAELKASVALLKGKVTFYDNFGQTDWDVVKGHIRYMAVSLGIKLFYLDHLTAMADTSNEKESLEQLMKELAGLAMELGIIVHFVSHLSTPDGKPHEEGGRVMIRHFKGSRAIGFWSYFMFGLERDPQSEDPEEASTTTLRILKDRNTGDATGKLIYLGYNKDEGRLYEKPDYNPNKETNDHKLGPIKQTVEDDDEVPF